MCGCLFIFEAWTIEAKVLADSIITFAVLSWPSRQVLSLLGVYSLCYLGRSLSWVRSCWKSCFLEVLLSFLEGTSILWLFSAHQLVLRLESIDIALLNGFFNLIFRLFRRVDTVLFILCLPIPVLKFTTLLVHGSLVLLWLHKFMNLLLCDNIWLIFVLLLAYLFARWSDPWVTISQMSHWVIVVHGWYIIKCRFLNLVNLVWISI